MSLIAESIVLRQPSLLSSLNDIWGNTITLGLTTSNTNLISINSNNFKYYIEVIIFDNFGEQKNLGIFTTPPRPQDVSQYINTPGYGAISTSAILRAYLSESTQFQKGNENFIDPTIVGNNISPFFNGPIIKYQINYGFQYSPNINGEAIIVNISGNDYLGFTFSSIHPFIDNATINIISDNPEISGNFAIQSSGLASYSLATTTFWTASMASGTNLINVNLYNQPDSSVQELYGFDSVFDFGYFSSLYNYVNKKIVDSTSPSFPNDFKFLTNYPNWGSSICDWDFFGNPNGFNPTGSPIQAQCFGLSKRMRPNDYETISVIMDKSLVVNELPYVWYNFYDINYNLLSSTSSQFDPNLVNTLDYNLCKWNIPIGFANLTENNRITNTASTHYIITWIGTTSSMYSEARYFYIDRTCSIYEPVQIVFKNRLGSWDYFTFTQDNKKRHSINRNLYKQQLNYANIEAMEYDIYINGFTRGNTIISSKIEEEFTLNSNWISEIEYEWLSELVESTNVYISEYNPLFPNYICYTPIIITDTSYDFKTFNRDQIFNLTINYKLANDKPTQMI